MKIGIIGATGRVGTRVLAEAENRQHIVTVIVRDISKLTGKQNAVINKDIFSLTADDLASFDVIVNAFGAPFGQEYLHMKVVEHLITLLQGKDSPRMVVVGGAGSLYVDDKGTLVMDTPNVPAAVRPTAAAQGQVLNRLKQENGINWTFISPSAMFAPGKRTGKYRIGSDRLLIDDQGQSRISMEDYAIALVDELENPQHIRARFTVGY